MINQFKIFLIKKYNLLNLKQLKYYDKNYKKLITELYCIYFIDNKNKIKINLNFLNLLITYNFFYKLDKKKLCKYDIKFIINMIENKIQNMKNQKEIVIINGNGGNLNPILFYLLKNYYKNIFGNDFDYVKILEIIINKYLKDSVEKNNDIRFNIEKKLDEKYLEEYNLNRNKKFKINDLIFKIDFCKSITFEIYDDIIIIIYNEITLFRDNLKNFSKIFKNIN